MPIKDIIKRREYRRKWYSLHRDSERAHVSRRKKEIKIWFKKYKEGLKCSKCGESHPAVLDFHHKNKREKEFGINTRVHSGYSIIQLKKEIDKCEVLCANCHRKLHFYNNKL